MPPMHKLLVLIALAVSTCQGLKMSPAEWLPDRLPRSPMQKRQQGTTTSIPSTTTLTTNFGTASAPPNTCVCRLVSAYNPFVTITSIYTASNSNDGVTTTTIAQPSGSVSGTVEVITPVSFVTTTSYYDATTTVSTIIAQPSGTVPGTVLVELPALYTTTTIYNNVPSATTTTIATYTGGTAPGTIVVESPGVYVTTYNYDLTPGALSSTYTLSTYTGGTNAGTIEIEGPGIYTTYTTYWGQTSSATSTAATYTGPSGPVTNTGTIVVLLPASQTPVANSPAVTIISQYPAPATTGAPVVPSGQTTCVSTGVSAPTACNNQGLEWAEYTDVSGDWTRPGPDNNPPGWANFQAEPYKTMQPNYQGVVSNIGGFNYTPTDQGTIVIYNSTTIPSDYWVLNHQGYLYPAVSGIYNFTSYAADDIVLLWIGPVAYTGWTRSNAALEQVYNDPPQGYSGFPGEPPVSLTVNSTAGQYYPFRIMYANAQRQAQFHIIATTPDGVEFLGPDIQSSPYVVRYSCDMTTAPMFPAFGNQS